MIYLINFIFIVYSFDDYFNDSLLIKYNKRIKFIHSFFSGLKDQIKPQKYELYIEINTVNLQSFVTLEADLT